MNKIILLSIGLMMGRESIAQWLSQDAEGRGSFLFKGTNASLDLVKTDLSFNVNNLHNPVKVSSWNDNHFLFYGGGLQARAQNGLNDLFTKGELVPSGSLQGFLGYQLANSFNKLYKEEEATLSAQLTKIKAQQSHEFINQMNTKIDEAILSSPLSDSGLIKKIKREWKEKLAKSQPRQFAQFLQSYKPDNVAVGNIISNLLEEIETIAKENAEDMNHIRNLLAVNREEKIRSKLWRLSIFALGGVSASSFKRADQVDPSNLPKSFINEDYRGGNLGIGINYQVNRWKLGTSYSYKKANNFKLLHQTDYKLNTVTNSGGQVLTQEMAISAYAGQYGEVEINEINADIIYSLSLGSSSQSNVLLNGFINGNVFSRNEDLLPNSYNVGLGGYFYTRKSRFLGGLYVEAMDVNDSFEKNGSVTDQGIHGLTFGIVLKYCFNTLISHQ